MNKFKINNIYNEDGKTLNEIITSFFINYIDDNDINKLDGVL